MEKKTCHRELQRMEAIMKIIDAACNAAAGAQNKKSREVMQQ